MAPDTLPLKKHFRKQVEAHTVTFTPETWQQICAIAADRHVSYSDVVRHLLAVGLDVYTATKNTEGTLHG